MNDRYRDRHDYYGDDYYADADRYRASRSADEGYDYDSGGDYGYGAQDDALQYRGQSWGYGAEGSVRSSNGAGAYASGYRSSGEGRRLSQGNATRRQPQNVFEGYYPDESVDAYRRSSYGAGASAPTSSHSRYARQSDRQSAYSPYSADTSRVGSTQRQQRGRGSQYGSQAPSGDYAPKRSSRKRTIIIAAIVVLAVVLVGAGAAWAYVNSIQSNLHAGIDQDTLDALEPATPTQTALADTPFYMLLLGVDMADWRRDDPAYAGDEYGRSDSMMLARIDPVNKKAALISIHRDTMVSMGQYGEQKINAAYEIWGPAGAIQAVSTMAGVPISHYAAVDFDGFSAIVDELGGIEVNVPMVIDDPVLPTHIDAGWQVLDGEKALDLCRSRHSYDDVADDGDVMRAANQRMVIGAIVKKILSSDIMTIANSVQTLSRYVTTDLNVSDIIGLAQIYQGIDPAADIYTAMEPTTSAYIDETWYEFLDEAEWKEMISRMDQGLPPVNKTEIDDRTGTVLSTGGSDAPVV